MTTRAEDDIADYLATNGHGVVGTSILINNMTDPFTETAPVKLIEVVDSPNGPPMLNYAIESVDIQILNRDDKFKSARDTAEAIRTLLHNEGRLTINATHYLHIKCTKIPFLLKVDSRGKPIYSASYEVVKKL